MTTYREGIERLKEADKRSNEAIKRSLELREAAEKAGRNLALALEAKK